jgi:hypothetical protein
MDEDGAAWSIRLHGRVVSLRGDKAVEGRESGVAPDEPAAAELGARLADRLIAEGASQLLSQARSAGAPAVTEP